MGGSTTLIIVFVAIVAALLGLWAYRRSTKPTSTKPTSTKPTSTKPTSARNEKSKASNQAEQWGVRISAPAKERTCPQAQEILGKEFPIGKKPPLPLPDCPYPHQCECRYIKLFDRRRQERRSDQERREGGQRFEVDNPPRRSGADRRKSDIDWV
jgi:FtsZ-interacting cell division protein ZipA